MAEHNVIVYSTDWCPWCTKAKDWLTKNNVKFEVRDPEKNPQHGEELATKSKQTGIPVVDIDGHIIIGYDEATMKKYLEIK